MKRILILILLFTNYQSSAQYTPLHLDFGTCWNNISYQQTGPNHPISLTENTSIIGDTTISNMHYYIAKQVAKYSNMPTEQVSYHFFRNDTSGKKVYSYHNGSDTLLYDFSLGMGDTIKSINLVVDTMGIALIYGVNRKFFGHKALAWDSLPSMLYFEGIGESRGIARNQVPYIDSVNINAPLYVRTGMVNCAYNGLTLIGDSTYGTNCAPLNTSKLFKSIIEVEIFPNPTSSNLSIEIDEAIINCTIEIKTIYGQTIFNQEGKQTNKLALDKLSSGIYILTIRNNNKIFTHKILKD